jgi:hypothetical protein
MLAGDTGTNRAPQLGADTPARLAAGGLRRAARQKGGKLDF